MPSRPTVLLFEPNPNDREPIRAALSDHQATLIICESVAQILAALIQDNSTKCLIANAQSELVDLVALQRQLAEQQISLPMVAVLDTPETKRTVQLIKHGVIAVFDKPIPRDVLIDALEEALAAAEMYVQADASIDQTRQRIASLTTGQRQVLYLVVAGTANKVIASRLGVSVRTIENWRRRVFQVVDVSTVADLVRKVMHLPPEQNADTAIAVPTSVPDPAPPATP